MKRYYGGELGVAQYSAVAVASIEGILALYYLATCLGYLISGYFFEALSTYYDGIFGDYYMNSKGMLAPYILFNPSYVA
jgi:hypothetical protein